MMELSYYQTRLLYDTIRNLLPDGVKSDDIESYDEKEQLLVDSSASISKLLSEVANLFHEDYSVEVSNGEKGKSDILEFAESQLHRSRDELIRCNQTMLTLSERLRTLNSMAAKISASTTALIDGTETIISNSSANIRSNTSWFKGAEEKIKMHAYQVMRETYLDDETFITQLSLQKQRLYSRRTAQNDEKKKVRGCYVQTVIVLCGQTKLL
jgi:hypothetical protein